ncbi:MAG: hypothetical protein QOF24_2779 [Verrucomicrobiota bacterium]|jgi:hypothetical protein
MKRRLAIAAGIISFLALIGVFGYLRMVQWSRSLPLSAEIKDSPAAVPKTEGSANSSDRGKLERTQLERAREEAERRTAENQMAQQPPAPPSSAASATIGPGATPNLNLRSGHGRIAPSPSVPPKSASSLEEVDTALQKLDWGQMAFDVSEKLRLEQTALVHLLISPAQTAEELTNAIREQTTEPVKIESAVSKFPG